MFYADFVLSKKGPLARIWLAAHWDKKLTKAQIFETNIESSVERILRPKVKLALRTSGHLMLGVVRIYSRKTKYLLADCNEAFVKIKMAFRPGMVDLPEDYHEAAVNAVTLPEVFHDFDSVLSDLNDVDIAAHFRHNQSRADEITIREDDSRSTAVQDEFGNGFDFPVDQSDVSNATVRNGDESSIQARNVSKNDGQEGIDYQKDGPSTSNASGENVNVSRIVLPLVVDAGDNGFGNPVDQSNVSNATVRDVDESSIQARNVSKNDGQEGIDYEKDGLSTSVNDSRIEIFAPAVGTGGECGGLFEDSHTNQFGSTPAPLNDNNDDFDDHLNASSPGGRSSNGSRPHSPIAGPSKTVSKLFGNVYDDQFSTPADVQDQNAALANAHLSSKAAFDHNSEVADSNEVAPNTDQTTLLQNEEESFALAPVDASALKAGLAKTKRKRKLIVDEVKNISGEEMKGQLSDTSDIVITLDLAPPTKRLMRWKETGGMEKLFALAGKNIPSTSLFKNYQRHLTSKVAPNDDGTDEREHLEAIRDGSNLLDINIPQTAPPVGRRGRKRKQMAVEDELAPIPEDTTKKTRKSPQIVESDEGNHLATIAEELMNTQPVDSIPEDLNVIVPATTPAFPNVDALTSSWIPENNQMTDEIHPPPSVTSVAVGEELNTQSLYQNQQSNKNFSESKTTEPSSVPQPFPHANNESGNQISGFNAVIASNKDSMMENMGYNGHDQYVQNQDPNVPSFVFDDDHEMNPITPGINAGGGITPWHEADYDNPVSVGPSMDEREQQRNDETAEQFEERILNKRAGQLYCTIRMRISSGVETTFGDLTINSSKKQIAQRFYSLLVLKKARVLELTQIEPYGIIKLTQGSNFEDPKL